MDSFATRVLNSPIGKTQIFYLGQAGFLVKTKNGTLIGVDLYLSNCCERIYGFKRLMPYLLEPTELIFDVLLATHAHEDHFDVDSLPAMMHNDKTTLLAAKDAYEQGCKMGFGKQMVCLTEGCSKKIKDILVHAVFCDHGPDTPDAIGVILEVGPLRIYVAGDTALHLERVPEFLKYGPIDVMICPINGRFGNMNELEAVQLCGEIKPKIVIPCHYWNFAEHGGDPSLFMTYIKANIPDQNYKIMAIGEMLEFP